jgi:hypothetical protein
MLTYFNVERISKCRKIIDLQEEFGDEAGTKRCRAGGFGGPPASSSGATRKVLRDHTRNTACSADDIRFVHSSRAPPSSVVGKDGNTLVVVDGNTAKSAWVCSIR